MKTDLTHVLIIPDGNRRYALEKKHDFKKVYLLSSSKITSDIIEFFLIENKISELTIFALSRDNVIKRNLAELKPIFEAHYFTYSQWLNNRNFFKNGVTFNFVGDIELLPKKYKTYINKFKNYNNLSKKQFICNILVAYDGTWDINQAVKKMLEFGKHNILDFLLLKKPVDLVVRTGKVFRLSGAPMYLMPYAEIFFLNYYYPDLNKKKLKVILQKYNNGERRFGK